MTIYLPDISSFQAGIRLAGAVAVVIKATEGTGYANPYYAAQQGEAHSEGAFAPAYHFLHQGNAAGQADYAHGHVGSVPAMIDAEPTTGADGRPNRRSAVAAHPELRTDAVMASAPGLSDICSFTDEYRKAGGTVWWVYLPSWYWRQIGSPSLKPLRDRGLLLWSSIYQAYTDAGGGAGWQAYGGSAPQLWQYTSSLDFGGLANVDFSAFRGSYAGKQDAASVAACLAEFEALSRFGRVPPLPPKVLPPVRGLAVKAVGDTSVRLQWDSPAGPSPFAVGWYQVTIRRGGQDLPSYPRTLGKGANPENHQFGSLPLRDLKLREKLTAMVRAVDKPARTHASEWSAVEFPNG